MTAGMQSSMKKYIKPLNFFSPFQLFFIFTSHLFEAAVLCTHSLYTYLHVIQSRCEQHKNFFFHVSNSEVFLLLLDSRYGSCEVGLGVVKFSSGFVFGDSIGFFFNILNYFDIFLKFLNFGNFFKIFLNFLKFYFLNFCKIFKKIFFKKFWFFNQKV